jgi:putative addiction module component (TIGR02574 family)
MIARETVLEQAMALPPQEGVRLVQDLWDTLDADELKLTAEQEKELDEAWAEHLKNPGAAEDWGTFRDSILDRRMP